MIDAPVAPDALAELKARCLALNARLDAPEERKGKWSVTVHARQSTDPNVPPKRLTATAESEDEAIAAMLAQLPEPATESTAHCRTCTCED